MGKGSMLAVVAGLAVAGLAAPGAAQAEYFRVKGDLTCLNHGVPQPLSGVRVMLWDDNEPGWNDPMYGPVYADEDGRFNVKLSTKAKSYDADIGDDVYLSIELATKDGGAEVYWFYDNYTGVDNLDTKSKEVKANKTTPFKVTWEDNYGIGTPNCAMFLGAKEAVEDYRASTGSGGFDYDVTVAYPNAGVPFTAYDETKWPNNYPTGYEGAPATFRTSLHEYGHALRHRLDGGEPHFLFDAGRFNYLRHHQFCDEKNLGFAFNEGWAEYWAGQSSKTPCGGNAQDYEWEGNVANALKRFADTCATRAQMVDVLRRNPGAIHSLPEFRDRLRELVPACKGVSARALASQVPPGEEDPPALTPKEIEDRAVADVSALTTQAAALRRRYAVLARSARDPKPCGSLRTCTGLAELVAGPRVLLTQANAVSAMAQYAADELAAAKADGFQGTPEAVAAQEAREQAFEMKWVKTIRAGARSATRALDEADGLGSAFDIAADRVGDQLQRRQRGGLRLPEAFVPQVGSAVPVAG